MKTTRQLSSCPTAENSLAKGGSYKRSTVIPWTTICWTFFRTYLLDRESDYILVGDEVVVQKRENPLMVYLVSFPQLKMEQIVRGTSFKVFVLPNIRL